MSAPRPRATDPLAPSKRGRFAPNGWQFVLDAIAWVIGIFAAELLRYEFAISRITWLPMIAFMIVTCAVQLGVGWLYHLYRGRYVYGTFEEIRALGSSAAVTALIVALPVVAFGTMISIPRSTPFIALPIALLLMFTGRYLRRLYAEHKSQPAFDAEPTLIFGAGYLGSSLVRRMATDAESMYRPVGIIDDDPRKSNMQVRNVRVLGGLPDVPAIADQTGARVLVVAIARAEAGLLRQVQDAAQEAELRVKVMPPLSEILGGRSRPSDMRDLSIEDLIGRHVVDTEVESIAGYLGGKRVLVTGAGGSIGAELCQQIAKFSPSELIMLDRDETGLQQAQLGTVGHGLLDTRDVVLADIRDAEALERVFQEHRPEVVFHAAALKHLPMLEQYPDEAWKTNVIGTLNVLRASQSVSVGTFINISTDKAANPTSVLGHSKRVAEKLTAWMGEQTGGRYLSVRFGNVIGSRGSMLPTFASLIEAGGPVTVTHPEVTRYFMTIPEACQLVVQAGAIGEAGEVLILDMGDPVRILDVAERMIAMSGKNVAIVYTGLRDGEKLHEELIGASETTTRRRHPKISHARVDSISPERLDKIGWEARMRTEPRNSDTAVVAHPSLTQSVPIRPSASGSATK